MVGVLINSVFMLMRIAMDTIHTLVVEMIVGVKKP